ncbi:hypothetical protein MKX46_16570 [Paenibacillus sp. FSL P4-0113]|uniref:hypothetical protein n=1 Tax=Paenibacillus sp. FSL P4-0113 TaxID=2921630 RepID=UPI0030F747B6
MKKIDKSHNKLFDQFVTEYSKTNNLTKAIVNESIDHIKAIDTYIEVYFKDGEVYTVNQSTEKEIAWAKGNDFLPGQTGFEDRNKSK